jgi:hypothetical protein
MELGRKLRAFGVEPSQPNRLDSGVAVDRDRDRVGCLAGGDRDGAVLGDVVAPEVAVPSAVA